MKITEQIVQEFVKSAKQEPFKESLATTCDLIDKSMESIVKRNQLISSYRIIVANEVFSGTEIAKSSIDLFLEIYAINLELNYEQKGEQKIKRGLSEFFKNFRSSFRLFPNSKKEQKLKKQEKKIKKEEQKILDSDDYDVETFYKDLQLQLAKNAYKTTKIGIAQNHLVIFGKDELVKKINIYPVFISGDSAHLYNIKKRVKTKLALNERLENIKAMNSLTKNLFKLQVRIFNNLYWNIYKCTPNQIFMEQILPILILSRNILVFLKEIRLRSRPLLP